MEKLCVLSIVSMSSTAGNSPQIKLPTVGRSITVCNFDFSLSSEPHPFEGSYRDS